MTQYFRSMLIIVSCLTIFLGCGKEKAEPPPSQNPPQAEHQKPSTLHCKVSFSGVIPKMKAITMNADPKCMKMHTQPVYFQNILVNSKGLLQNVFIYIKEGLANKIYPTPKNPKVLDQEGCTYHPHVSGIQVNQPLRIENSDPVLHNIHAVPQINKSFNFAQPMKGMKSEVTFSAPEIMVRVKCDVHSWMGCYIGVLDHPFYAVTDTEGTCDINGLPPGDYLVSAWHEELGTVEQKISVKEGITENIEFTFAAKK